LPCREPSCLPARPSRSRAGTLRLLLLPPHCRQELPRTAIVKQACDCCWGIHAEWVEAGTRPRASMPNGSRQGRARGRGQAQRTKPLWASSCCRLGLRAAVTAAHKPLELPYKCLDILQAPIRNADGPGSQHLVGFRRDICCTNMALILRLVG
jgi:hypothetical protein